MAGTGDEEAVSRQATESLSPAAQKKASNNNSRKRKNNSAAPELTPEGVALDSSNFTPTGRLKKKAKQAAGISTDTKKRKPKKERPPAKSKEKAPVDVERQCGVPLPNGGFCARSLTCKTHSMGAKRAVPGRSQPYDALLLAYQKRNQVKMASLSTKQQLSLDNEALMEDTPLNEEEEFEQVMSGVMRARPVPLERKVVMPSRLRGDFFRMREMLIGALNNVPPAPSINEASTGNAQTQGQNINTVMAATGNVLGRTIVFDTVSGAQYVRPPRVFVNNAIPQQQAQQQQQQQNQQQQQAALLRQRQIQMLQMKQQQQQQQQQQPQQQQNTSSPSVAPQTINSTNQFPTGMGKPQAILQSQLHQ
ncbi:hypothetical protein TRICI_005357 [Trichomonascus ciferrii]|uniref:SCA7 domain-containing protein n=1 Tax=Trichomonascus ciferrii TaxID=44093 RepID=A0A642UT37_9ASCO|nr:hypothetical protein TRICI_005357 [Trichomonascus ciferrii]